jgi:PPM family protein phosphatase
MIRIQEAAYPVIARSHPGSTGKNNEDRFAVSAYRSDNHAHSPILLAVISDGIGGHRGGEIASEMTVNYISDFLSQKGTQTPLETLRDAIQYASNLVFQEAESENGIRGMGATTAVVWIIGKKLFTSHVGDSRIYLIRNRQIYQLSVDHSWVQEAIDMGLLSEVEAKRHPNAHVIRRYLGSPKAPDVDQRLFLTHQETDQIALENQGMALKSGDRILLTTDGITDLLQNDELLAIFENGEIDACVNKTIEVANERGGFDNLSIIAIDIPNPLSFSTWFDRNWHKVILAMCILLIALLVASLFWLSRMGFMQDLLPLQFLPKLFSVT